MTNEISTDDKLAAARQRLVDRKIAAGMDVPDMAAVRSYVPALGDQVDYTDSNGYKATATVTGLESGSVRRMIKVDTVGWIGLATVRKH